MTSLKDSGKKLLDLFGVEPSDPGWSRLDESRVQEWADGCLNELEERTKTNFKSPLIWQTMQTHEEIYFSAVEDVLRYLRGD
jgi:hypothetical protein